jgi:hypothetical protein
LLSQPSKNGSKNVLPKVKHQKYVKYIEDIFPDDLNFLRTSKNLENLFLKFPQDGSLNNVG